MSEEWVIGIIGGSGLYAVDSLEDEQWIEVKSSFGEPSDAILCGRIAGVKVRFLPRHGRGHRLLPHEINYRANIAALKIAGACRMNVVISGGTGSGKTTMLNALSKMIDPGERVLTIEDAAELRLQQPHWLPSG